MTLSEAIRLGALLKPQGHHGYFDGGATCALGAAADALGRLDDLCIGRFLECQEWPVLSVRAVHPLSQLRQSVWATITEINDLDGWTREEIADWVESVERESASAESLAAVLVEIGTQ